MTPIGWPETGLPPPTVSLSFAVRCGSARAWAVKSFMTSSRSKPSWSHKPLIEKAHGLLVILTWSPVIADAIAMAPWRGIGRSPRCPRYVWIASKNWA